MPGTFSYDTHENASVVSFIGHGAEGVIGFYGYPNDTWDVEEHKSAWISEASMAPPDDPRFLVIGDLPAGYFDDVYLAVLLSCGSGSPDPIEQPDLIHLHLPTRLVEKGADLALGFYGEQENLNILLGRPWNEYFWAFASGQVQYEGEKLSIYDSWYWASELASEDCGTCSEEQRDILRRAKFVETNGVSKHENLWPARYGKIDE